eukprot:CAMPEP_0198726488 /NCGR_PEP_ID=MMETSP1475-20131203/3524_1 /TAXON_ID= ORGANISM="Unidentified sp., Strain CCMP1999" /NCGR_SAMPLE_ID=MMETSP1475 /ASSEMBLY_ACC=CAM_ASM_001111 /LENGTH=181 /DNA_ID=CAMNT_0044488411 /DNA_START=313 /DNA_END=858 /DNA_ORIENTATION=+
MLSYLGLYYKNAKILFLGLDNAGKTTLMRLLRDGKMVTVQPTQHATAEEVIIGNVRVKAFDLGGHLGVRQVWRTYYNTVDAVVFLVDSTDRERFPEARQELSNLLADQTLANVPFLVLGNKIDLAGSASEDELRQQLGLQMTTGKSIPNPVQDIRPVEIFMCSLAKKVGYGEGFRWVAQYI